MNGDGRTRKGRGAPSRSGRLACFPASCAFTVSATAPRNRSSGPVAVDRRFPHLHLVPLSLRQEGINRNVNLPAVDERRTQPLAELRP